MPARQGGAVLATWTGASSSSLFGVDVGHLGDANGDGCDEVIVGASTAFRLPDGRGLTRVYRGKPLTLLSDRPTVSVAGPNSAIFYLEAGAVNASKDYLLAGSITGTTPGIPIGVLTLPLNFDPYFLFTVFAPNAAPLSNSSGRLDVDGRSTAYFTVDPGIYGALVGFTIHHAYAVFSPNADLVSNAAPLTFVP